VSLRLDILLHLVLQTHQQHILNVIVTPLQLLDRVIGIVDIGVEYILSLLSSVGTSGRRPSWIGGDLVYCSLIKSHVGHALH